MTPFGLATTAPRRRDDLAARAAELEALQQQFGAPKIEQDSPGFLARTIDVLSGFNFATAGFVDEIGQGNGLGAAVSRATRELLSSARSLPFASLVIPEIKAEKEAFGKVLEDLGMPTITLGDVLPALEGTIVGEWVNTRGALGLVFDVAADPLTYFTFGAGGAIRRGLLKAGSIRFSRGGDKLFRKELTALRKEVADPKSRNEFLQTFERETRDIQNRVVERGRLLGGREGQVAAFNEARESMLQQAAYDRAIAKHGVDAVLDQGGIKWWGRPVIKGKTIRAITSKYGEPVVDAVRRFEWGAVGRRCWRAGCLSGLPIPTGGITSTSTLTDSQILPTRLKQGRSLH
jgi:hypothetical protein